MNIAVGKIGQKLIFDRNSDDATRSNNNGNVDAYKFYKLLFEKFTEGTFWVFGDNDGMASKQYSNVVDVNYILKEPYFGFNGIGLFYCGLEQFDTGLIEFINRTKLPYYLFTTDSRCVPTKVTNKPIAIYSLAEDKEKNISYSPVVTCLGYDEKSISLDDYKKKFDVVISTSDSDSYDRVGPILRIIEDCDIPIYGRNKKYYNDSRFKGEIKYEEMINIFKQTKATILSPIDYKWTTGKYVECLLNNVIPLFVPEYGYEYLGLNDTLRNLLVIDSREKLFDTVKRFSHNELNRKAILCDLRTQLKYNDILSGDLMYRFLKENIFDRRNENV